MTAALARSLDRLRAAHRRLDAEIARVQRRPGVDSLTIAKLKKQKLALKDRIAEAERALEQQGRAA